MAFFLALYFEVVTEIERDTRNKYSYEYSREEVEMSWHVMMNMPP